MLPSSFYHNADFFLFTRSKCLSHHNEKRVDDMRKDARVAVKSLGPKRR